MARFRTPSEGNLRECCREANSGGSVGASFSLLYGWTSWDSSARRNFHALNPSCPRRLPALSSCTSEALGNPARSWPLLGSHDSRFPVRVLQGSRFSAIQDLAC